MEAGLTIDVRRMNKEDLGKGTVHEVHWHDTPHEIS